MSEFVTKQTPDMKLTFVNDAYCDFTGKTRQELIGRSEIDFIYHEDINKLLEFIASITIETPINSGVFRFINKEKQIVWVEWTGRAFFNDYGHIIEYQAVGRDITARKKAREQLQQEVKKRTIELEQLNSDLAQLNSHLNNILTNISDGVFVIDSEGKVEFLNNVLLTNLKTSQSHFEKQLADLIFQTKNSPIHSLLRDGKPFHHFHTLFPSTDGDISCLISGSLLNNNESTTKTSALNEPTNRKAMIIVKPLKEVNKLVNDVSGSHARYTFDDIVTKTPSMRQAIHNAQILSANQSNVLITGESGTGKELFAQSIHNASKRSHGPFIAINCGTIPRDLIGSELFGYSDGAFTGARKGGKPGKFELAQGGTLFLDEIGDMPLEQQVILLRVIQEKRLTRIGGNRAIPTDVRIICATNKSLFDEMNKGNFRQDLYYRLNVMSFKIPPLRERVDDIALLFDCFIKQFSSSISSKSDNQDHYDQELINCINNYTWPGNVRELQNITERLYYIANGGPLTAEYLPARIRHYQQNNHQQSHHQDSYASPHPNVKNSTGGNVDTHPIKSDPTLHAIRDKQQAATIDNEKAILLSSLAQYKGNVSRTAKALGLSRSTLYRKMKLYQVIG
ncbi:hypothetical protein A3K86_03840 [Photobacterium jeanii]|uniref:Sigma-54-dependent Fis family transcriptional regulator n=2 Tax=Photobacterium jeanii TaxID=858640 RepID=A0A178KKZ9_9GAMM|nr:hypothetical protein A3K86_03840 [Photobacterium jeanii]PST92270.1 PAS domain S-box protein [Photobacterium jeanii]